IAPKELKLNQDVKVFIYTDNQTGLMATPEIPIAEAGDFAYLKVGSVTDFGAFLKWGISKDLLIPANEQKQKIYEGDWALVYIDVEVDTGRVFATSKLGRVTEKNPIRLEEKQKVKIIPFEKTPLGFKVLIDKKHLGMIYHNEIFTAIKLGQELDAFIKEVRPDNLIDVSLQTTGMRKLKDASEIIWEALLKSSDGTLSLHDKSTPLEIQKVLGISKQAFKKAVGMLYKKRKIILEQKCIRKNG
ncbi:MAG: hypothetical protein KBD63_04765, partial [Bacteriovoracaceae bacterium]|nr:hypothetical protein [Bacteriovoracaceae bacterium]